MASEDVVFQSIFGIADYTSGLEDYRNSPVSEHINFGTCNERMQH